MKVSLSTAVFLEAVGHAAGVAASKSPKPILECVVLRADLDTGLVLEATDLDVGLRLHVDGAEVMEGGTLVVPAGRLLAVAREVEDETITIQEQEGALVVDSGRSHFRIRGEDSESAIDIPSFPPEGGVVVPGGVLREMIRRTVFATAKEAGRYALHGVLFKLAAGRLELVATDGRRLARAIRDVPSDDQPELKVIVGPKGLSLLDRLMGPNPGDVALALGERQVLFRVGGALLVSRLIDGTFPAYEDVIPRPGQRFFEVGASDFAAALRKASLLTTRDALSVQVEVEPDLLVVRSRAAEVGEARVEVAATYAGAPERLGFNPAFLLDVLKVVEPDEKIRFEFANAKSPGKLTDGTDYVYVVMPIALE